MAEDKKDYTMKGIYLMLLLSILAACKKAEELHFDHAGNIHFNLGAGDKDSIVYTFAYTPTLSRDTIWLPVQLAGIQVNKDRSFSAYVETDSSTAKSGIHYEPLKSVYTLRADTGRAYLPVIIYNVADLENESVSLVIKLKGSNDLGIEIPTADDGSSLLRAKIVFSAMLEQPNWWNMWLGSYYSRTKHQLFLIVTGVTQLTTVGLDAPRNLYLANLLTTMLNDPFKWVANNPAKGYVLEASGDDYYFYNKENPARKILLRKNAAAGKYYFIDENGEEVN
ncbi:DUF4843 domain-containing protein [Chitinophaga sancti]|uniref:DUF4843 domain-containing protein n=1 Tax=Chitinophaga sancti TaxID=1004 RepID=A0A1K1SJ76_9BACT|nr:DUF4843 domain-containing protein [Chitinophaga sancti]WQD64487.1 DUF4843 domain-containing protein [Chitinophaga sancti]WQG89889.1 DUF4843 domain-containing protein [Chitinophaga sancti]SFW84472.1 protein of unknown function [Chitinophaga sancti]